MGCQARPTPLKGGAGCECKHAAIVLLEPNYQRTAVNQVREWLWAGTRNYMKIGQCAGARRQLGTARSRGGEQNIPEIIRKTRIILTPPS
jgi:hypothetical protein